MFSIPFCKYWSNIQTVSKTKFSFGLKKIVGGIIFCLEVRKKSGSRGTPFLSKASMRFVLPTSGLDLPCALRSFTGIPAMTAKPPSSVFFVTINTLVTVSIYMVPRLVGCPYYS